MRKEKLKLEKREYLQPSITMYETIEEAPLLAGTNLDVDDPNFKETDWKDEEKEGGDLEL